VRTDSDGTLYVTHEDTGRIYRLVNNKLQVMEYNDEGELVVGSGKDSMYNWFRDGDDKVVKKYFVDNSTNISNPDNIAGEVTKEFKVGDIIQLCSEKLKDGAVTGYEYTYYVALKSDTFTVNNDNIGTLVTSGDFVKINNYRHDKQTPNRNLTNGTFPKYSMNKGDLMITDKGEIYMYVGSKKNMPYAGIDDTNYLLLNAKNQGASGGTSDFDTRKAEIVTWISNNATAIADNSSNNSLTRGDVIKSGDKYYITLNTNTYDFQYGNTVSVQAGWGNFAEFTNKYYGAADVDASGNLPTLYAGDIVVDSDGTAYVYMDKNNAGNSYIYPLAASYTNLCKLNVQ
jgi:hypothetical protein